MKNKILTWLALSVIFCLSSFETKAQSVYIQDIIEYIDKNGQEFDALIGVRGIRYTESLNLPKVTVLEGDYIVMKATSCTYVGSVEGGHLYKLHLEIAPAMDFGERLRSHIEFTFDLEYDRWCSVDFWTVQPGLSIGEITPSEQDIAYRQSPQILTYSSDDRPSIQSVQWQQKDVYTSDWINISGANSYTYSPRPLSQTTEFRVVARSKGADIEHTEPAIVRVSPQLVGGTVSGDQTIFPDGIPLPFTNSTAAFGGSSDITYQWQAKTEQGNWTDVPNAKGLSYDPPALTTTTKFRRKAVSGEEAAYSNVVTVSVREPIAEYLSFRPIAGVVSEEDRDMRTVIFHLVLAIFLLSMEISRIQVHTEMEIVMDTPTPEERQKKEEEQQRKEEIRQKTSQEEVERMLRSIAVNENAVQPEKRADASVQQYVDEILKELEEEGNSGRYKAQRDKNYQKDSLQNDRDKREQELDSLKSTFYAGESSVSYNLKDRYARFLPIPVFKCEYGGKVVVEILVNPKGVVQKAKILEDQSQSDDCLWRVAADAAKRSRFNEKPDAPALQKGTITYNFVKQ